MKWIHSNRSILARLAKIVESQSVLMTDMQLRAMTLSGQLDDQRTMLSEQLARLVAHEGYAAERFDELSDRIAAIEAHDPRNHRVGEQ